MGSASDTISCTNTKKWEYGQIGTTPSDIRDATETYEVNTTQTWIYDRSIGWSHYGSLSFPSSVNGLNYVSGTFSTINPPDMPAFTGSQGQTTNTGGTGRATYSGKKEFGKQPIYGWMEIGNSHSHPPSVSSSGHTLYFKSCSANAGSPSGGGSVGSQTTTTGAGYANYYGEWDDGGGTGDKPSGVGTLIVTSNVTSLRIQWNEATNADRYALEVREGNSTGVLVFSLYNLPPSDMTVNDLKVNTTYHIKVYAINGYGNGAASEAIASTGQRWTWTTLVNSANTDPNKYYNVNVPLVLVSATEWNNFCIRINDTRRSKGLGNYAFTSVSSNREFTNAIYMEAVNAITPMKTVSRPVGVYSKLIALKDALNSI